MAEAEDVNGIGQLSGLEANCLSKSSAAPSFEALLEEDIDSFECPTGRLLLGTLHGDI
ncbi:hypothetical protein KIN20_035240 [Parelaphostrongylus tenuis]|uniref:Uncharacterized protein n=1 Tax=Parelaphostrongylus tenuis TaxID=148309 RepID=A0AAD5RAT6_PARTN|nr:hypothetical protein KIN20_035240 [Parelaphostrongylus tenuis]